MNKKYLHHLWVKLRPLSYWYFLAAFLVSSAVCVAALRQNNLTVLHLRDEVLKVDQQNGDVEAALRELRAYMYSHMNTNLASGPNAIKPPVQLKYRYERLVQVEKDKVTKDSGKIYTDAQEYCERTVPEGLSGRGRVPCIQEYVAQRGFKEQPIPDSLYKFDFASPRWSPDLAGLSMLASGVFLLLFIVRFGLELWLKHSLRD
ncbi:MAG: hypothetical protein JWL85_567 [Candidatus Saccharibacteria bacterium]|nr:hypothetical protein [Candidatus Saccharibacteria bacterium]